MKKGKVLAVSLVCAGLVSGVFLGAKLSSATEEYVSVPNTDVKNGILAAISENEEITEEELANFNSYHYIARRHFQSLDRTALDISINNDNFQGSSLEGIEDVEAEQVDIYYPIVDVTPLGKMKYIKDLVIVDYNEGIGYSHGLSDLSALKNLETLETFHYLSGAGVTITEENIPLLDISALNELPNLQYAAITTHGYLPAIHLTSEDNNYEMRLPITLSKQFNETNHWSVYIGDSNSDTILLTSHKKMSDKLQWKNISTNTEYLVTQISLNTKDGSNYDAKFHIPIIWE